MMKREKKNTEGLPDENGKIAMQSDSKDAIARGVSALQDLLVKAGLEEVYERFLTITQGPRNGKGIVPVAVNLQKAFHDHAFWEEDGIEPFSRWDELFSLIAAHQDELVAVSSHFSPPPHFSKRGEDLVPDNPMYGDIDRYPLFAMLCSSQVDPNYRSHLRALHLQILQARWIEAKSGAVERGVDPLLAFSKFESDADRWLRRPHFIARSARDLSHPHFRKLLEFLEPGMPPEKFCERLKSPEGLESEKHYTDYFWRISNHCLRGYGARNGRPHEGGEHASPVRSFQEYIDYNSWRVGIELPSGCEEDGTQQKTIYARQRFGRQAKRLGLHPYELMGGRTVVARVVPGARSPREATAIARAEARSWEIDRRLFPWGSTHLRLEDFRRGVLPALERIANDPSSESDATVEMAAFVAIAIDTCRDAEEIVNLRFKGDSDEGFTYKRPARGEAFGRWSWDPIGPDYTSTAYYPPEMEASRAFRLHYPASKVVTDLIERYLKRAKCKSAKLFRGKMDYGAVAAQWIKEHDPTGNCTLGKLRSLRWEILHHITGGEIASACLLLGINDKEAVVELHYAILRVAEACHLYHQSSIQLWGEKHVDSREANPEAREIIGIRGYPLLSKVKEVVAWMQAGSKEFFHLRVSEFDPTTSEHVSFLNRAVLYVLWHQFFAFATRAIRDAYQDSSLFSRLTGLGVMSDKDFDDHHKTRLIWADRRLLKHMRAMEERLARIRERMADFRFRRDSPVWFIGDKGKILRLTPGNITSLLKKDFPFEVNTPRKISCNLLRQAGLRHEQAEAYMGHWWQAREPWAPFSSFDWHEYLSTIQVLVPYMLEDLGFTWVPGEKSNDIS